MINQIAKPTFFLPVLSSFFLVLVLWSCDSQNPDEPHQYTDSTGPINMITIVSDTTVYNALYPIIRTQDMLGRELPGSLIPQSLFGFRNFTPSEFDRRPTTRMILNIKKGDPRFENIPSNHARNQAYMEIYGNNLSEVVQVISDHKEEILEEFNRSNFTFLGEHLKNAHKEELSRLGVYMKIPNRYNLVQENPNYQWYRLDKIETISAKVEGGDSRVGTQTVENFNIQIERAKLEKDTLSKEEIKSIVNGYGLNRLKGDNPGEYLEIQKEYYFVEAPIQSDRYTIYEFDGMWEMKDAYYGGSFVGKIIIDKIQDEMYFALVSINAPNPKNKRDNILHALSMIKTFKVLKPE